MAHWRQVLCVFRIHPIRYCFAILVAGIVGLGWGTIGKAQSRAQGRLDSVTPSVGSRVIAPQPHPASFQLTMPDTLTLRSVPSTRRDYAAILLALMSAITTLLAVSLGHFFAGRIKDKELKQALQLKDKELEQALRLKEMELDRTLGLKARETERAELDRRLSTFFGPLKQKLDIARVLHDRLREGDPEHRKRGEFRTVIALLRGDEFSENDRMLINELVATTRSIRKLILGSEGIVEDERLLRTLSMAASHFRILELAAAGKLKGDAARFENTGTYPVELDAMLQEALDKLRKRKEELSTAR